MELSTITHKISGTSSSFYVEERIAGKFYFLFSEEFFLLVFAKLSFWWGDWALGYHSLWFRQLYFLIS